MQTKIEPEETKNNASWRTLFLTDYTQTYLAALKAGTGGAQARDGSCL